CFTPPSGTPPVTPPPDPCVTDPDGPGCPCTGQCVTTPDGWVVHAIDTKAIFAHLWSGPEGVQVPSCPSREYLNNYGYLETPPELTCPPCTCGPSAGKCTVPPGFTAYPDSCPGMTNGYPFFPSPWWDGTCQATGFTSSVGSAQVSESFM